IEQRRAALNDVLLFDILLTSGGIRAPDTLYPPSDVQGLSRLLHAIEGSKYDRLKKNCLVYFLLKWHKDEREKGFAEEKSIMPQFVALADAYWYLDSGYNVARAISNLSDPRLNRDYASKIMQAIDLENKPQLIVKYVRCAQPLLTEPDDIDLYTICLAEGSLLDAWQFIRTFHDRTRARLLEKLLRWTNPAAIRPEALSQLLSIPLTKADEDMLQNLCTNAPSWLKPPALYVLQDLACTRLVQVGRHVDAINLDRRFCSVPLKEGWSKGGDEGRRKMIQELIDALPSVERAMLDVD
ncbi:nuclear pore complex assembly-domain-containing protein, partial [Schizophyllum commune]